VPEIVCVQGVGALRGDGVLFVERSSELLSSRKPKPSGGGAVKASLNRAKLVMLSRPETE
jgi:hypothetical protein